MAGEELNLRTVIEAVLDAKGFDDFQAAVKQAKTGLAGASTEAETTGGSFQRLGVRLPHTAFHLLSYDLIEQMGLHGHLRPLVLLSTTAMDGLATSTRLMSNTLVQATLGASLLIPLLLSMRKETKDGADAFKELGINAKTIAESLETLKTTTGGLTAEQAKLLQVMKDLEEQEAKKAIRDTQTKIASIELNKQWAYAAGALAGLKQGLFGAMGGEELFSFAIKKATDLTPEQRKQLEQLNTVLQAQRRAYIETGGSLEDYLKGLNKGAEANKKASEETSKAAGNEQKFQAASNAESLKNLQIFDDTKKKEYNQSFLDFHAAEEKKRKDSKQTADDKRKTDEQALKDKIAIDIQQRQADRELHDAETSMAIEGVALLSSIFGKNKAFAVADAIIRTYAGAARAFEDYPWPTSAIVAASVAAAGLAQVVNIEKQHPAGFDDPVNDALMSMAFEGFGRKWAQDAINLAAAGASRGFGHGMAAQGGSVIHQTTKIDRGTHIQNMSVQGVLGSPRSVLNEFNRALIKVNRFEDRTRRR